MTHVFHPPGYRPPALHVALVITELLGRISPVVLLPAWLALAATASWPWGDVRLAAAAMSLSFTLLDGLGLSLLPRLERSFGPVTPPLLALNLVRTGITFGGGVLWGSRPALLAVVGLQFVIAGAALYATWIEPSRIRVTRSKLRSSKLSGSLPIRLLHITDLHLERITQRECQLLDLVEELTPDLVVLTGDYLSLSSVRDSRAQADVRDLLADLCARSPGPVYAITGSPPVDLEGVVPDIFDGLDIVWLLDEVADLDVNGHTLYLAGLRCTRQRSRDAPRLRRLWDAIPDDAFAVLLYHSPDLMPEAVDLGVDLYLCGHTHGGQLRIPLFGALLTSSAFWKRYEMGRYEEDGTTLYVSRGLGMEGLGAPRARFLSPPEVILWTLSPD
ncbi:MAG: hypothetical protein PVJ55_03475 [Anaerolineae bacterium]